MRGSGVNSSALDEGKKNKNRAPGRSKTNKKLSGGIACAELGLCLVLPGSDLLEGNKETEETKSEQGDEGNIEKGLYQTREVTTTHLVRDSKGLRKSLKKKSQSRAYYCERR